MQEDDNPSGATPRWQPLSLRAPSAPLLGRRLRIGLMAGVALLHAAVIAWLPTWDERDRSDDRDSAMLVDFIAPTPPPEPIPVIVIHPPATGPATAPRRHRPPLKAVTPTSVVSAPSDAPPPLRLYDSDGRVRLSDEVMAEVDRRFGDQRQFEFQVPGLEDGKKLLDRPPVLTYEATRFAQYYKPNRDLLTEILTRAVDATTRQVTLPMPGHPGKKIVCTVSLLALGGGCGIADNRNGYYVKGDDPNTLSADEDKQCQAWWDKIVGATTQEAWRQTRALYEQQCRKPLERKAPAPPDASAGQ